MGFITRNIFTWGNKRPRRLCWAIGAYTFAYEFYDMSWATLQHNYRDAVNPSKRYGYGSWVVVSGANDDIGKEFAKRFADKGFNLILIDSDEAQLSKTRADLSNNDQRKVETIVFDHATQN